MQVVISRWTVAKGSPRFRIHAVYQLLYKRLFGGVNDRI